MSATQCMRVAESADFKERVKYFVQKASVAVMSEIDTTTNHADRLLFAKAVLAGGVRIEEYVIAVTTNSTIASTISSNGAISDSDLEFTVNSLYDAFAG